MEKAVSILDCTLRDGGMGIVDLVRNGIETECFSETDQKNLAECIRDAGIDIIELGWMEEDASEGEYAVLYQDLKKISAAIPERKNDGQMFVGLYTGPDTDPDKIPEHTPELCDGVRVILRYSELRRSLDFCTSLAGKGYKVFVQPMLTMRYTDDELKRLVDAANDMGAYALYFVDSFGYMEERDIERLFRFYDERLEPAVQIGFHAHNNMDLAFCNARHFIRQSRGRGLIVDACLCGMGQGAGNLQTELAAYYLNREYGKTYKMDSILKACEILGKFRPHEMESWGYSPFRLVPAFHKTAYKYAAALCRQYHMPLTQINDVLTDVPDRLRHRYTPENLKELLDMSKIEIKEIGGCYE